MFKNQASRHEMCPPSRYLWKFAMLMVAMGLSWTIHCRFRALFPSLCHREVCLLVAVSSCPIKYRKSLGLSSVVKAPSAMKGPHALKSTISIFPNNNETPTHCHLKSTISFFCSLHSFVIVFYSRTLARSILWSMKSHCYF